MTRILWELSIVYTIFKFLSLKSLVRGKFSSCGVVSLVLFDVFCYVPQKSALKDVFVHAMYPLAGLFPTYSCYSKYYNIHIQSLYSIEPLFVEYCTDNVHHMFHEFVDGKIMSYALICLYCIFLQHILSRLIYLLFYASVH